MIPEKIMTDFLPAIVPGADLLPKKRRDEMEKIIFSEFENALRGAQSLEEGQEILAKAKEFVRRANTQSQSVYFDPFKTRMEKIWHKKSLLFHRPGEFAFFTKNLSPGFADDKSEVAEPLSPERRRLTIGQKGISLTIGESRSQMQAEIVEFNNRVAALPKEASIHLKLVLWDPKELSLIQHLDRVTSLELEVPYWSSNVTEDVRVEVVLDRLMPKEGTESKLEKLAIAARHFEVSPQHPRCIFSKWGKEHVEAKLHSLLARSPHIKSLHLVNYEGKIDGTYPAIKEVTFIAADAFDGIPNYTKLFPNAKAITTSFPQPLADTVNFSACLKHPYLESLTLCYQYAFGNESIDKRLKSNTPVLFPFPVFALEECEIGHRLTNLTVKCIEPMFFAGTTIPMKQILHFIDRNPGMHFKIEELPFHQRPSIMIALLQLTEKEQKRITFNEYEKEAPNAPRLEEQEPLAQERKNKGGELRFDIKFSHA